MNKKQKQGDGIEIVFIPQSEELSMVQRNVPDISSSTLKELLDDARSTELHVTAYYKRKKLSSEKLQKLHENLLIVCDEDGYYKHLPENTRACKITGLKFLGDVILYHENEEGHHHDLCLADIEKILEEMNKLYK